MSKIIIVISKNNELDKISQEKYDEIIEREGTLVKEQTTYKEISELLKGEFKDLNTELYTSEIFSYQNQGKPSENDFVILIDGADRYNYIKEERNFRLKEFNDYQNYCNSEKSMKYNIKAIKLLLELHKAKQESDKLLEELQ